MIREIVKSDRESIRQLLIATGVFSEEEIEIALELIDVCLSNPEQTDYEIFTYGDEHQGVLGYICIGPTPATESTYDLYWIAVSPDSHGKGIGSALLEFIEHRLSERKARLLIAETSSTSRYDKTRLFYQRKGFEQLAWIKAYYKPDDDLVIYGKYL
jgi:ribosomal protein S18 acetylase RimI-like enzyme